MRDCDVVVVGAGVMGSSAAWWLARSGIDVVVLEQFEAGHTRGSSHGSTRIFRLAYPDPLHIDMARKALPLWRELEELTGTELLRTTGGVDSGDGPLLQQTTDALLHSGVEFELLDSTEAMRRWPGFLFDGSVLYQPDAGRVSADATMRALQQDSAVRGAEVHFAERVTALALDHDRALVSTDAGAYRADAVVVTAGAWVNDLLGGLVDLPPLVVTREQVFHFRSVQPNATWPCFIHHGDRFVYGLQAPGDEGVKVAEHHTGAPTTADGRSFEVDNAGRERVVAHVKATMPGLEPFPVSATTCLYTNSSDESFFVERQGPVVVGSACSGHAFKFAPLIGQRLAELARQPL